MLINGAIIRDKKFNWDLSLNATFLQNTVRDIPAPVYTGFVAGPIQVIQNGQPMQTFYTRKFLGMDKGTGLSVYEDDGNTFFYVGNPNPKTLLGISTTCQYKKFSLTANMFGAFGHDIYNVTLMAFVNRAGIESGGNIAESVYTDPVKESPANPVTSSSRYIMKGNYFKLANLTLSYALGEVAGSFKGANLYVTGQNLFIITKYPGFNPEANSIASINNIPSLGIEYVQYPLSRTFIVGINFSL
jgi:iron complex outermembrane receptor protein